MIALGRRRGRGQDDDAAAEPRAHDRQVAGVVAEAILLLVGRVVLLVDDDEAEPRDRREECRAGADDRPRLAAPDAPPLRPALARPEPAVEHRDRVAEPAPDAI